MYIHETIVAATIAATVVATIAPCTYIRPIIDLFVALYAVIGNGDGLVCAPEGCVRLCLSDI